MGQQLELTLPAKSDKAYVSRETGEVGKVELVTAELRDARFALPIFAHDGPCFVSLRLGNIVDECACLKYLDGLVL